MYLARELLDMSTTEVGKAFGGRDHSTVIHAYDKIKKLSDKDSRTRRDLSAIKRTLGIEPDGVDKSVDNL
jgi:chromosomal replication initiator protein